MDAHRLALLDAHAEAERRFDLEATMRTLAPDPVFEWHPEGRRIRGPEAVRRMYQSFLTSWRELDASGRISFAAPRGEWFSDAARIREEVALLRGDDGVVRAHFFVVVVHVADDGVLGERTYASPELLRVFLGEHYLTVPIDIPEH